MRVFLSGPMGSGKSTLARHVGAELRLPVYDLDTCVEQAEGRSVPAIFEEMGEAGFRRLEADVLRRLLADHAACVISLGGGTVTQEPLRRWLLEQGTLITLQAPIEVLASRVGGGEGRPLLQGQDVVERLRRLLSERSEAYAECHGRVSTAEVSLQQAADAVAALARRQPLLVPLGERSYRVEVGVGVRNLLTDCVGRITANGRVVVVSDEVVAPLWAQPLRGALSRGGWPTTAIDLASGEQHKRIASVERIWSGALSAGVDRSALLVGVGGGVVGDLTGFAAATLLRGVAVAHVPTTLLAMVDSAIGGKTGFDTDHGKNLVGAFHQPSFVLCDVEVLRSLPPSELRAGLAEVVKSAWLAGEEQVAQLERDLSGVLAGEPEPTVRTVRMCAALKASVVTQDEREAGRRAVLNLGHTLGHAIEASVGFSGVRHGEAVALGMVAATRLAVHVGVLAKEQAGRLLGLIGACGLSVDVDRWLTDQVLAYIGTDKKRHAQGVRFVVPGSPGQVELRDFALDDLPPLFKPF